MSEQEIYKGFIDWLREGSIWDTPETDELIPLVQATYTLEEAALLTGMPYQSTSLEELARLKQMDPSELKGKLDTMSEKGLVFRTVKDGTIFRYKANDSYLTFMRTSYFAGKTDERSKAMAPLVNQYFYNGFYDEWEDTHYKGLRTLPIEGTMEDTREILPYEEVAKVLDNVYYFSVSTCPCRHRKALDEDNGHDCAYPGHKGTHEVCLHFDRLGKYLVENGMAREITREETHQILRECAEAGLIHGLSNMQEGPDTICNCCRDCCLWFEAYNILKHSVSLVPSNYLVRTDPESCIGCGTCVKRCHMQALRLEDYPGAKDRVTKVFVKSKNAEVELKNKPGKVAVLTPDLCIGCGVCVVKCQSSSLVLERNEEITHPPKDVREATNVLTAELAASRAKRREVGVK